MLLNAKTGSFCVFVLFNLDRPPALWCNFKVLWARVCHLLYSQEHHLTLRKSGKKLYGAMGLQVQCNGGSNVKTRLMATHIYTE